MCSCSNVVFPSINPLKTLTISEKNPYNFYHRIPIRYYRHRKLTDYCLFTVNDVWIRKLLVTPQDHYEKLVSLSTYSSPSTHTHTHTQTHTHTHTHTQQRWSKFFSFRVDLSEGRQTNFAREEESSLQIEYYEDWLSDHLRMAFTLCLQGDFTIVVNIKLGLMTKVYNMLL